jgi:hypothetical protein
MRARKHKQGGELAARIFYRLAHLGEPALARTESPFAAPSCSRVTFLSRFGRLPLDYQPSARLAARMEPIAVGKMIAVEPATVALGGGLRAAQVAGPNVSHVPGRLGNAHTGEQTQIHHARATMFREIGPATSSCSLPVGSAIARRAARSLRVADPVRWAGVRTGAPP